MAFFLHVDHILNHVGWGPEFIYPKIEHQFDSFNQKAKTMSIIDDEDEIFFKTAIPLKEVLSKEALTKYFYEFSKRERNTEALDFYLEVSKYKNLKTKEERIEAEKTIFNKYLEVNSPYAINISVENITSVKQNSADAPVDLYDSLQKEMEVLMMDSYRRFFKTPAYEEMQTNNQIEKKMKVTFDHEQDDTTYDLVSPGIALRAVGKKNENGIQLYHSMKDLKDLENLPKLNDRVEKSKSLSTHALKVSKNPNSRNSVQVEGSQSRRSKGGDEKKTIKRNSAGLFGMFFPKSEPE